MKISDVLLDIIPYVYLILHLKKAFFSARIREIFRVTGKKRKK